MEIFWIYLVGENMRNLIVYIQRVLVLFLLITIVLGCAYERRATTIHMVARPTNQPLVNEPKNVWSFRVLNAKISKRKRSGLEWESDGTAPDPFVRLNVDGRQVWQSEVKENTNTPEWNVTLPHNVEVKPNSEFRLELWDRDTVASADPIGVLKRRGLPPTARPKAITRLMLDSGSVLVISVFEPRTHEGVGIRSFEVHPDCLLVLEVEKYSPAGRAGIRPDECIVEIDGVRIAALKDTEAVSKLSLAAKRKYSLKVADQTKKERKVELDEGYIWLTM